MDDVITVFQTIGGNLLNPAAWQEALAKPELFWATFIAMNIIIFAETGLLIGFFLPGDSLLVSIGVIAHSVEPNWPIHWLILSACRFCHCRRHCRLLDWLQSWRQSTLPTREEFLLSQRLSHHGSGVLRTPRR